MRWDRPASSSSASPQPSIRSGAAADRTSVRLPPDGHRPAADPAGAMSSGRDRPAGVGVGAAGGCGRPPAPRRGRSRRPRTSRSTRGRDTSYTTPLNDGSACHLAPGGRRRDDRGSIESSRETGPALGATVLDHGAACPRAHPGAKAVLLRTAVGIGLKCTLHDVLLESPARALPGRLDLLAIGCTIRSRLST